MFLDLVPDRPIARVIQPIVGLTILTATTLTPLHPAIAQAPAQTAAVSSDASGADNYLQAYTLDAGDRIRVEIFKIPQLSGEQQVLVDGTLNLPQVGIVSVRGLTLKQSADKISAAYAKLLRFPIVTVSLLTPRPIKVGISGEVNRPGSYSIPTAEGGLQLPTVTRALQAAGGITQLANLREVQIRRPQASGPDQIIPVNLWEFLQTGDLRLDVSLRSGDTIFVPTTADFSLSESVQIANASFSTDRSQPLNIAVVGEVYRPGPYTVSANARTGAAGETGQGQGGTDRPPTITRAIQVAGGIRPMADVRRIQIRRTTRTGEERIINVDLWRLLNQGDLNQDIILQDRDTVVIPTATEMTVADATQIASASFSPNTIRVNVVGEVKQPGVVQVLPNTPLNQALLAAGGFNNRARKSSVDLIRLNPNGTVTRRRISVDFAQGINEEGNPGLRNDDVVVVGRSSLTGISDTLGTVLTPVGNFFSLFRFLDVFLRSPNN